MMQSEKKILFVFATELEAVPFLKDSRFENLIITGIGSKAVIETLNANPLTYDEIWNIGYAGGVSEKVSLGEIHSIYRVGMHQTPLALEIEFEGKKLITFDEPLYDTKLRDSLAPHWDLVDMEGYAVATFCKEKGIVCRLFKIVSDRANAEASKTIRENAPFLSARLYDHVLSQLIH